VSTLESQLDQCAKDMRQATVAASSAHKNILKTEKLQQAATKELEHTQTNLDSLKEQTKELESKALVVMQAYETEKTLEQEMLTDLVAAQESHALLAKEKNALINHEIELAAQVDTLQKAHKELVQQAKHWTKKLAQLEKLDAQCQADYDFDIDLDDDQDQNKEEEEQEVPQKENQDKNDAMEVEKDETSTHHQTNKEGQNEQTTGQGDVGDDEEAAKAEANADQDRSSLPRLSKAALKQYQHDISEIQHTIEVLEGERDALAKTSNMGAISEYKKKEADYMTKVADLDVVTSARNEARKVHEELRRQRLEMFMEGFGTITLKLKEMYQMITLGGDAELELVDSLDPFSEGIVFSVRPPKKSWKNISNLSGGEKTLSSLALVFALHHYRPTPLYVMDEIDAALDFKNVSIVANYIKTRTKNAQFIIISLRNNMFELADRLVGIYKTNHCTKSITIDPAAFASSRSKSVTGSVSPQNNEKENDKAKSNDSSKPVGPVPESTKSSNIIEPMPMMTSQLSNQH
jgi:structural maintenance of chromosome 4